MRQLVGTVITLVGLILFAGQIKGCVKSEFKFENRFLSSWSLADKSSTIDAKSQYIDKFVADIISNKEEFADYDAVWLKTPNNSFENNLNALVSLKNRLSEIKGMDPTSFQYNTAIQQITQQEQGEAGGMISVIQGCWDLHNYSSVWNWIGFCFTIFSLVLIIVGLFVICPDIFDLSA